MNRRPWIAVAMIVLLIGLNVLRYTVTGEDSVSNANVSKQFAVRSVRLSEFSFPIGQGPQYEQTQRDVFSFSTMPRPQVDQTPPPPVTETEEGTGPDAMEVALEAAKIDMMNVRVTGVLSSQDGLTALLSSPFFEGVVFEGTNIGKGLIVSAISARLVQIKHSELGLLRKIPVE